MGKKRYWECLCGGTAENDGMVDGHPAMKCKECGKAWWYEQCPASSVHVIDSRFAVRCGRCGKLHCPVCWFCSEDCPNKVLRK